MFPGAPLVARLGGSLTRFKRLGLKLCFGHSLWPESEVADVDLCRRTHAIVPPSAFLNAALVAKLRHSSRGGVGSDHRAVDVSSNFGTVGTDRSGSGAFRSDHAPLGKSQVLVNAERRRAGANRQFRRIRPRLPVRLVSKSLDFLPPAEERLQLAGAVDETEYIHPVFQQPVENEHPFKP